jgi:periplasmic protein TonB
MARDGLRGHLSGSVPISIAAHLAALLLLLIIPLAADVALPTPASDMPDFVRLVPLPPPPAFEPAAAARPSSVPAHESMRAPVDMPPSIAPEPAPVGAWVDLPVGPAGVVPDGLGAIGSIGPPVAPPPDSPKPSGPVRLAQLPVAPRKIVDARPIYPDIARAARVEGTVMLEAVLDPSGHVTQLRVVKSVPLLDQAAIDAVRQWRYTPSAYGGHPVSVLMTITIRFTLQQ